VWSNNILFIPSGRDWHTRSVSTTTALRIQCVGSTARRYSTPLVLGISFPPVRSMAWRMARARALKADSALWTAIGDLLYPTSPEQIGVPVVVVLAT
jgi:hypothetical protein